MNRIDTLIECLCGKRCELDEACKTLGFSEEDLTLEELDAINKELFRCSDCKQWVGYKEFNVYNNEPVCDYCYDKWFEEEDY